MLLRQRPESQGKYNQTPAEAVVIEKGVRVFFSLVYYSIVMTISYNVASGLYYHELGEKANFDKAVSTMDAM